MSEQPGQGEGPRQDTGNGIEAPARPGAPQPQSPGRPGPGQPGPGPQAPGPGPGPLGRPPVNGPADPAGRRALWLGIAAVVFSLFFPPGGLVLGIAALVIGIKAHRRSRGRHGTAPGATPGIVLASVSLVLAAISIGVNAWLWPELSAKQDCMDSANTRADEKVCNDTFTRDLEKKLHLPKGELKGYGDLF
ncbi:MULTISPECIES: DUF4190 domain-containing protein [Actinomadura]|uniref:DUF4190 domain-containing protein n=1 Tax=Actinomadura yumaensis TaxID=111807 RepID=A0ABW2CXM9_9ACTN|nr:DUF4190 domain-containing protein [Actinomadura sp. J1-007]MWK36034.1 hypothetical protein [Actinomadura sp. J1-007]